jgi:hypothetical protein
MCKPSGFEAKCRRFRRFRRRNISPVFRRQGSKGDQTEATLVSPPPGAGDTCRQPAIFWACLPSTPTAIRGHPRPRTVLVSRSLSVPSETARQSRSTCNRTMLSLTLSALPMARLDRAQTQRPTFSAAPPLASPLVVQDDKRRRTQAGRPERCGGSGNTLLRSASSWSMHAPLLCWFAAV